ncbi:MAG: helix-turn-helix transcriptional regulator [Microcoleaceae cyanobacterium]
MDIQDILTNLVKQIDDSLNFPIFQRTEKSVSEILFESDIDGTHYYLVRCRPHEAENAVSLSPREQAIAHLVAQGLPNKCIGKELGISRWTVATHLRRVYKKLGVSTRASMTARLVESNLLHV